MIKLISIINKLIIFCSILGVIFFANKIVNKQEEYRASEESFEQVSEIYNKEENDKFKELKNLNADFRGWIKVEGTNIDYPITQADNNTYYLKHDFFKKSNPAGTVFLDYENNHFEDFNTIIYAHYMKNKTLFHNLQFFKEESFFKNNEEITIETADAIYKYEVFSIHVPSTKFKYTIPNFSTKEECNDFINEIKKRSLFKTEHEVTAESKILTLSTCSYEFKDARTVVHALLVDTIKK